VSFDIVNPEALGSPRGWNNGMLAPPGARVLFIAGQTATGADGAVIAGGMAAQWDLALDKVLAVVHAAGGQPADIGRMTVFVTDRLAYLAARRELGEVWRLRMGRHYPAMSVVEVTGLVDEGAVVEIEATAVLSG
jgi:enamine deaminase RidA (YjgF/YER057c/UK114 family)